MVLVILLSFLLFIILSAGIGFLFLIYLPSLNEQKININSILFSRMEETFSKDFPEKGSLKKAVVLDDGQKNDFSPVEYRGPDSCRLFFSFYADKIDYHQSCIGFGDCVKVCPKNAIHIQNGKAHVTTFCNACGLCIDSCPRSLIKIYDFSDKNEARKFFSEYHKSHIYKICQKVYNLLHRK